MRRLVNNRWIYADLATRRMIRKSNNKLLWVLYPIYFLFLRLLMFVNDTVNRNLERIEGGKH